MRIPTITLAALTALGLAAGTAHAGHPAKSSPGLTLAVHHGGAGLSAIHDVRHDGHHGRSPGYHPGYGYRHPGPPVYRHHGPPVYRHHPVHPRSVIPYPVYPPVPSYRYDYYRYGYPSSGFYYSGPRVSFGIDF